MLVLSVSLFLQYLVFFKLKESNDIFQQGLKLMAIIGFVMIAVGLCCVINATGGVTIFWWIISAKALGQKNKGLAAFLMLLVGLFITMGIGSSFSTVPIITSFMYRFAFPFDSHRWQLLQLSVFLPH